MNKFKALLLLLLSALLSGCSNKSDFDLVALNNAKSELSEMYYSTENKDEYIYPANYGGSSIDVVTGELVIYTVDDNYSFYDAFCSKYDLVRFETVKYTLTELEQIRADFIADNPNLSYESIVIIESRNLILLSFSPDNYANELTEISNLTPPIHACKIGGEADITLY